MTRSREWLLFNAVETWLFHYGKSGTPSTVEQYKELQKEFHDAYMASITVDLELPPVEDEEPKPTRPTRTTRKRTTK